ncbi:unnamed protein product [Brassica oleracea]
MTLLQLSYILLPRRFLNRAAISCDLAEIEETKAVLRLVPIWMSCLVYAIVNAQASTFFIKQGATMDRSISPGFLVPSATFQSFINISIVIFIAIYDRVFVPAARSFTQIPSGITMLQRIGTGIFLSIISMVVRSRLVRTGTASIPMSVWWLVRYIWSRGRVHNGGFARVFLRPSP